MRLLRIVPIILGLTAGLAMARETHGQVVDPTAARASVPCAPNLVLQQGNPTPLVNAYDDFGFRLFSRLFGSETRSNVFISPLSAALDLSMVYNGARGQTQQGMAKALGLKGIDPKTSAWYAAALLTSVRSFDRRVQLEIANSLWAQKGVAFQPNFMWTATHRYGAQVQSLDFSAPTAVKTINGWVSCATHGKIASILNSTSPADLMYLINTVYFHGLWSQPFTHTPTTVDRFTIASGARKQVHMMHQMTDYPYYETPTFQAVSLAYGKGRYSMVVVLPKRGVALSAVTRGLSTASWRGWTSSLKSTLVNLSFPRFTVKNSFNLGPPLTALGMGSAFAGANFSGMCKTSCSISDVLQKTYLGVYEKGTTAAAVTATLLTGGGAPGIKIALMVVDHPFLVAIRDQRTGAILFMGAINNPTSH